MIKYYFMISSFDRKSPDYMKPIVVCRFRDVENGIRPERWNGQEWVIDADIIAASGIGGDNPYERTTEAEAMKFIASHTKKNDH
jgi:hypothetical protein